MLPPPRNAGVEHARTPTNSLSSRVGPKLPPLLVTDNWALRALIYDHHRAIFTANLRQANVEDLAYDLTYSWNDQDVVKQCEAKIKKYVSFESRFCCCCLLLLAAAFGQTSILLLQFTGFNLFWKL